MSDSESAAASGDVVESIAVSAPAAAAVETPAVPEEATPAAAPVADDGPQGPRWAALAKREKEVTLREKAAKEAAAAREAALTAREKDVEAKLAQATSADDLKKLAREKPTEFFKLTGLTYADVTAAVLKEGEVPTPEDRVAAVEAKLAAKEKAEAEAAEKARADADARAKAEEAAHVDAFKANVADFVTKNAETYELVAAEGAHDLVYDLVEAHYAKTYNSKTGRGEIMAIDKAAELAEAYLLDEATRKYAKSKKLAGVFAPPAAAPVAAAPAPVVPPIPVPVAKKPTPQITNKNGVSGTVAPTEKKPLLSPREIAAKYRKTPGSRNAGA